MPLFEPALPNPIPFGLAFLVVEEPETVSVPETKALMFPLVLVVDGILEIDGFLIEV